MLIEQRPAAMSSSLTQTLNAITATKLLVLSKQHADFKIHSEKIVASVADAKSARERVQMLLDGINSWQSTDKTSSSSSGTYLDNVKEFLVQAQHDPSISETILRQWELNLNNLLNTEKVKFEYAELFGRLLSEWIASSASFPEKASQDPNLTSSEETSFDDVELPLSDSDTFERVGRKEMHEQRVTFESLVFSAKEINTVALDAYLDKLFSPKEANRILLEMREDLDEFGKEKLFLRNSFKIRDLESTINSLLVADLLSNDKRGTLKEFLSNKTVLTEVADVLNMHLAALPSWSWIPEGSSTDAIAVEMRRQLNGKYRIYMDEEILQAIFLHWIGLQWAAKFKHWFNKFARSSAWKLPHKPLTKVENERRQYFLNEDPNDWKDREYSEFKSVDQLRHAEHMKSFFMSQLPESLEDGARPYDDGEGEENKTDKPSAVAIKQSLLHILVTECLFNTFLYNKFTVVRSDFSWFGPSLPHSSILATLKFFGVPDIWLTFFKKFLSAPIKFVADGPMATTQIRKRGTPMSHSLSDLFGEVVLFPMDFAVNQRANGLFLYRIHDDFWWWNKESQPCVEAWQEMNNFARIVGLEFNNEKTGSVSVGEPLHPDLPVGTIKWGLLKFEETGQFVIDQSLVDAHIEELKLQLKACNHSVFAWVQAYNKYMTSLVNNFGSPPACCSGQRHVDMVISTLQRIQLALFPEHGGSVIDYLATVIQERFGVHDIPAGWFMWPIAMGGLEVKSPFISQLCLREGLPEDPKQVFDTALEAEKEGYTMSQESWDNGTTTRPYTENKSLRNEPFLSYEEYIQNREQRRYLWLQAYQDLTTMPLEHGVQLSSEMVAELGKLSDELSKLTGTGGISGTYYSMTPYWRWIVACFGEGILKKWGGLEVVRPGTLPVGMVEVWQTRKVRWEQ
uniref:Reverse transcriptase domain-containing protein n=2 Tax=Physcomitrium patens TaxID=3218 RepID=A0A7I4DFT0_PHYPA